MSFSIVTHDGRVLVVHTEVGDGLARVVVDEPELAAESIEESE